MKHEKQNFKEWWRQTKFTIWLHSPEIMATTLVTASVLFLLLIVESR